MPVIEIQASTRHVVQIQRQGVHFPREYEQGVENIIPDIKYQQNCSGGDGWGEEREDEREENPGRRGTINPH